MTFLQIFIRVVLVVIVAALAGTAAYLFSARQDERYQATTRLLFAPATAELRAIGFGSGDSEEEREIANKVFEVESFDVARATAKAMNDPRFTPDRIANDVTASNERGSDVVTIRALAESPQLAATVATQYRRQFIFREQDQVQGRAKKALDSLREALIDLPRVARRTGRGDTIRSQMGALEVLARTGGDPVIAEGTKAGAKPVEPQTTRNTLFGVLFGALLGVGLVALRGATRSSSHTSSTATPEPVAD